MKSVFPTAAILLGILLLVLSALWSTLFPPTNSWTDDKSAQLAELGSEVRRLGFMHAEASGNPSIHSGTNPAELKVEYDKAVEAYDSLHGEFASATNNPQMMATILRWTGIALVIVAAGMVLINREGT